ncbi:sigma factor [Streptomyces sp. NPDC005065]|uniref:RNA polymerase sigma factor n=1 Tax=Streptomyces sp. NPDC005065 TaxID=3154461 RepID=UPI0033A6E230
MEPDVTAPSQTGGRQGPAEDAVLVLESRGDPQQFAELYDRYAPDVHRYVARRLGDWLADDVTAETFLVAFRRRYRFDPARGSVRLSMIPALGSALRPERSLAVRRRRSCSSRT